MPENTGDPGSAQGANLLDYIAAHGLVRPTHLHPAAALIGRALVEGGVQAAISAPPRHGKSVLAEHAVAMALETRGDIDIGYFTYNWARAQGAATKITRATKVALHAVDERRAWRSAAGGTLVVGPAGGAVDLLSPSLDLLLIVDPVKNAAEAADAERLLAQWRWLEALRARLSPWGSVVILGSRWRATDMIGCAIRAGGWEHLNLPALDAGGAALFPELWPASALAKLRERIGEQHWATLYQGEPSPDGCVPTACAAAAAAEQ